MNMLDSNTVTRLDRNRPSALYAMALEMLEMKAEVSASRGKNPVVLLVKGSP